MREGRIRQTNETRQRSPPPNANENEIKLRDCTSMFVAGVFIEVQLFLCCLIAPIVPRFPGNIFARAHFFNVFFAGFERAANHCRPHVFCWSHRPPKPSSAVSNVALASALARLSIGVSQKLSQRHLVGNAGRFYHASLLSNSGLKMQSQPQPS